MDIFCLNIKNGHLSSAKSGHFNSAPTADPDQPEQGVKTAPAPGDFFDTASGKTRYDVSFVAKVVADKVENAIPLERQSKMFSNEGLPVAPATLEYLYKNSAAMLKGLYDRMVELIMRREILHVDETFLQHFFLAGLSKKIFLQEVDRLFFGRG